MAQPPSKLCCSDGPRQPPGCCTCALCRVGPASRPAPRPTGPCPSAHSPAQRAHRVRSSPCCLGQLGGGAWTEMLNNCGSPPLGFEDGLLGPESPMGDSSGWEEMSDGEGWEHGYEGIPFERENLPEEGDHEE